MKNINVILGRNGSDMHDRLCKKANEFALSDKGRAYFIVPDQYTLTAEKFLMESIGEYGMRNIRVLSFKHLASLVFAECGNGGSSVIGEGGRLALTSRAYEAVEPELKFFSGKGDLHFTDEICNKINELKLYSVSAKDLTESGVSDRVYDIGLIYGAYDSLLGFDKRDPADTLHDAADIIVERGCLKNSVVFIDFFKVLNASELNFISSLYSVGCDITMTLMCESNKNEIDFFAPVSEVLRRLEKIVSRIGGSIEKEYATSGKIYKAEALKYLEKAFLNDDAEASDSGDGICFYEASDISDEVDFVCCKITEAVREKGLKYSDFAVVCRDTDKYGAYIDNIFGEYGIPVIRHRKNPISGKKAIRFLKSLFDCIIYGKRACDVLELIRGGYIDGITDSDIAEFERYIKIWSVNGKDFDSEFIRSINGFTGKEIPSESELKILARAEKVRACVSRLISYLGKKTEKRSVKEHAEMLFGLITELSIQNKITEEAQILENIGNMSGAEELSVLYGEIIKALDEYVAASGEAIVSLENFGRMYMHILSSRGTVNLPAFRDGVLCGNADTLPLFNNNTVFVLGLTSDGFPKTVSSSGLISEKDRRLLEEKHIITDISPFDKYLYEEFIAYFVMTSATNMLYVSYPLIFDESEQQPSQPYLVAEQLFPEKCRVTVPSAINGGIDCRLQRRAPAYVKCKKMNIKGLEYISDYGEEDEKPHILLPETAAALYGNPIRVSASKSDMFYTCPYMFFIRYGLHIEELKPAEFSAVNVGTLIHESLDRIFKNNPDFSEYTNGEIHELSFGEVDRYMQASFGSDADKPKMKICADAVKKRLEKLLTVMRDELRCSGFKPVFTELGVGKNDENGLPAYRIDCGNGLIAEVVGSVDRIDALEEDGKTYFRVIDYKTGKKEFDLLKIFYGKNLQLPLYTSMVENEGERLFNGMPVATGMFYYMLCDEIEKLEEDDLNNALRSLSDFGKIGVPAVKVNPRSGMILDGFDLVKMDSEGKYIVPNSGRNKDSDKGLLIRDANAFMNVFRHVKYKIKEMGNDIVSGRISVTPQKISGEDPCKYCPVKSVCKTASAEAVNLPKIKDVIKAMEECDNG